MNRMDAENYDDLFITNTSQKILAALPVSGWTFFIEDDYADLKDYLCSRDDGIAEAFTRMDLVIMTPDLEPTGAAGLYLHFHFSADPAKLWEDRRAYGRYFQNNDCGLLRTACEEILHQAGITIGEPAMRVIYRPKNSRYDFGNGELVNSAYRVEISYWIPEV
jgi:hypothetical protein